MQLLATPTPPRLTKLQLKGGTHKNSTILRKKKLPTGQKFR